VTVASLNLVSQLSSLQGIKQIKAIFKSETSFLLFQMNRESLPPHERYRNSDVLRFLVFRLVLYEVGGSLSRFGLNLINLPVPC